MLNQSHLSLEKVGSQSRPLIIQQRADHSKIHSSIHSCQAIINRIVVSVNPSSNTIIIHEMDLDRTILHRRCRENKLSRIK